MLESDRKGKNNELSQRIAQAKLEHGHHIHQAFHSIGLDIPIQLILSSFDSLQKLGVTNAYLTVMHEDQNYIIRINGALWPPYKRIYEQHALTLLKENNIETNVLFNGDKYQICVKPDDSMKFSFLLEQNEDVTISNALKLISEEISKYHALTFTNETVEYPLEKMLNDAISMLKQKFTDSYQNEFSLIESAVKQMIGFISSSAEKNIFSHNDLLPTSIYVDSVAKKVSIVDWEYSGFSHWTNDLSILSCALTEKQMILLANHYYSNKMEPLSEMRMIQLECNTFLHDFLKLAWKITPANRSDYVNEISNLTGKLNILARIRIMAETNKAINTSNPQQNRPGF